MANDQNEKSEIRSNEETAGPIEIPNDSVEVLQENSEEKIGCGGRSKY